MIVMRLALTALLVIGAVFGTTFVWTTYFEDPWTRDGRVFANTVQIASYVPGNIVELPLRDNATVKKGDLLMRIDPDIYTSAVRQARAQVSVATANRDFSAANSQRLTDLQHRNASAVSAQQVQQAQLETQAADATLQAATASLQTAELNLRRTVITAPVDGYITNLRADIGDYAEAGSPIMAVVNAGSYRVDAYFMETKLPRIAVGAPARIRLMASSAMLRGEVRSIARAIADPQNSTAQDLLLTPEPSFEWIRLAQRVPVEISILETPPDVPLIAGATATVIVEPIEMARDQSWLKRTVPSWLSGFAQN